MTQRAFRHIIVFVFLSGIFFAMTMQSCRRADAPQPRPADVSVTDSLRHESTHPSGSSLSRESAAAPRPTVQDSVREKLLRRKGELLMAQKRVRSSDKMTLAQKDSVLRALEEESISLSKKLLEAGR